jgi:hypothetical protein
LNESNPTRRKGSQCLVRRDVFNKSFCLLVSVQSVRSVSFRIHNLLMPDRAAVAVLGKSRAIQASTILKYGSNGSNGLNEEGYSPNNDDRTRAHILTPRRVRFVGGLNW